MSEEARQVKFEVGDRVTTLSGDRKGTITRLGRFGDSVNVKWDNGQQELTAVGDLKKEEAPAP